MEIIGIAIIILLIGVILKLYDLSANVLAHRDELRRFKDSLLRRVDKLEGENIIDTVEDSTKTSYSESSIVPPPIVIDLDSPTPEDITVEESRVEPPAIKPQPINRQTTIKKDRDKKDLERVIGGNIFSKIGILVLIAGVGFFIKLAFDNEWFNESVRVGISYLFGVSMMVLSQKIYRSYPRFSALLAGGAFGVFYLTTAFAYHYYSLFTHSVAFAVLITITALIVILSVYTRRKELSMMALVGGFIAPFLLGDSTESYLSILIYIASLNITMFIISYRLRWQENLPISMLLTYILLIILSTSGVNKSIELICFSTLFFVMFFITSLRVHLSGVTKGYKRLYLVAFILNNFIYLAVASNCLLVLELKSEYHGLVPLFIAIVNGMGLLCINNARGTKVGSMLSLSMRGVSIATLTFAAPLFFATKYTIVLWVVMMITLLTLYLHSRVKLYLYFAILLIIICFIANSNLNINYEVDIYSLITLFISATGYLGAALIISYYHFKVAKCDRCYQFLNPILIILSLITYSEVILCSGGVLLGDTAVFTIFYAFVIGSTILLPLRFGVKKYIYLYLVLNLMLILYYLVNVSDLNNNILLLIFLLLSALGSLVRVALPYIKDRSYQLESSVLPIIGHSITLYITVVSLSVVWFLANEMVVSWCISIIMILIAASQILLGLKYRFRLIRVIGIFAVGLVLLKLVAYDVWQMSSLWMIISFIGLGMCLLLLSFMYQKGDMRKKDYETPSDDMLS